MNHAMYVHASTIRELRLAPHCALHVSSYYQEYIIKKKRVSNAPISALNVCEESRTWNANYLTTISTHVRLLAWGRLYTIMYLDRRVRYSLLFYYVLLLLCIGIQSC